MTEYELIELYKQSLEKNKQLQQQLNIAVNACKKTNKNMEEMERDLYLKIHGIEDKYEQSQELLIENTEKLVEISTALNMLEKAIMNLRVLRYTSEDGNLNGWRIHLVEQEWDQVSRLVSGRKI
jgi:hypothetical protein